MEGIEGKVDCATCITRHKLTVYKIVYIFTIVLVRELKFDNKQPGSATYLVCFHPGSNNRMLETLCKLPQYQSFKINTKFIHLILPQSSLGFVSLKQQKEH
jgi:hypothetical protein